MTSEDLEWFVGPCGFHRHRSAPRLRQNWFKIKVQVGNTKMKSEMTNGGTGVAHSHAHHFCKSDDEWRCCRCGAVPDSIAKWQAYRRGLQAKDAQADKTKPELPELEPAYCPRCGAAFDEDCELECACLECPDEFDAGE